MSDSFGGWSGDSVSQFEDVATDDDRYEWRDLLGRGGMGTVHAVFDRRLGREVAMKVVSKTGSTSQVSKEARITARLEHPGIVPVYDAGEQLDGSRFITMRMVRGVALSKRIRDGSLIGHIETFLRVCEAVAYANEKGIVHRDLKPDNVMVGAFGEVQVVDWGLAADLNTDGDDHTGVGTRRYASPQQLAGHPPSARDDVFGLGAILRDILELREAKDLPDLEAISEKARSDEPSGRYPSAEALATDVRLFIEGRLVGARAYSSWDLALHLLRRHRRGLLSVGLIVVALTAAGYAAVDSIRRAERDASNARMQAEEALQDRSDALLAAYETEARAALSQQDYARAERASLNALRLGPSPAARGVLMRTISANRPSAVALNEPCDGLPLVTSQGFGCVDGDTVRAFVGETEYRFDLPGVEEVTIGDGFVAARSARALVVARSGGLEQTALPDRTTSIVLSPNGARVGVVAGAAVFVPLDGEAVARYAPCAPGDPRRLALGQDFVIAACVNGSVRTLPIGGSRRIDGDELFTSPQTLFALAVSQEDERLAVGDLDGGIMIRSQATGELSPRRVVSSRGITDLHWLDERSLLVRADNGRDVVVDALSGAVRVRVPQGWPAAWQEGALVASDGRYQYRWDLRRGRIDTLTVPSGLAGAGFGGDRVALARGDGHVTLLRLEDGVELWDVPLSTDAAKAVVLSGETAYVAVSDEPGLFALDLRTQTVRVLDAHAHRRVAMQNTGAIIAARYDDWITVLDSGQVRSRAHPEVYDLYAAGEDVVSGGVRDHRWSFPNGEAVAAPLGSSSYSVAAHGELVVASIGDSITFRPTPTTSKTVAVGTSVLDLGLDSSGQYLMAGLRDGSVRLYNLEGELLALADEAGGPVAWVGFAPDGRAAAASWDGALRLYSMDALTEDLDTLIAASEIAWGP